MKWYDNSIGRFCVRRVYCRCINYYLDAYLKQFQAKVIKQELDNEGKWYIVLNETVFYPTGGGQPHDTGELEKEPVIGVEEVDGEIRHYVSKPIDSDDLVHGSIDWERRFDHMQQHAGQHLLSASFADLFNLEMVSFHLGKEVSTIDLHTPDLSEAQVKEAVQLANNIILENRPIETKWVDNNELKHYQLRKTPSVTKDIRLVIIPDFDYNACNGTHPKSTGEVRAIKVLNWERQKKNIRIQFVCGNRVLNQFDKKQSVLLALIELMSAPELDLVHVIKQRLVKEKELEKSLEKLKEELLSNEAKELISSDELVIGRTYEDRSIKELQKLAQIITGQAPKCTVFFVSKNENRLQVNAAKGKESILNCKEPVLAALPIISEKSGGSESLVQGGGGALTLSSEFLEQILGRV